MTGALYSRIEAIESFAADVAHELRNPLTSLRSAVETLPMAKTDANRKRLLDVIEHDVKRLDRLISDISDASRLDAELQRQEVTSVDLASLVDALVKAANEIHTDDVTVTLAFEGGAPRDFTVPGHDSRLGQVVSNLVDNARSFSPPGSTVRITCRKLKNDVEIVVDDDGPGIPPDAFEKSSSVSIPTVHIRASGRIQASACRSPSRSSKPMAAPSGSKTGPRRPVR